MSLLSEPTLSVKRNTVVAIATGQPVTALQRQGANRNDAPISAQRRSIARTFEPPFRTPPHNLDAEMALIGAIFVDNRALGEVGDFLQPSHFYDPLHAAIYETAATAIKAGHRADPITLRSFFENAEPIDAGLTVPQYLGRLAVNATTTANVRAYGRTVVELAIRRALVLIHEDGANAAYEAPIDFSSDKQIAESRARIESLTTLCLDRVDTGIEFARDASMGSSSAYVVKGVIPSAAVVALWGGTTVGKTFYLIDKCFRVARGLPIMGRRTRRGATLYVALEGRGGFGKRLAAAIDHHGDVGNLFARLKNLVTLGRSPQAEADVERIIAAARALEKQANTHVALIVIDTLARALAGDNENEAAAISAVVGQANRIAAATGAAVVLAHHPGKDHERGMRGSYALAADVDVIIKIEREPGAAVRQVILEKSKDGEEGPIGTFALEPVVLGQDDDGDDITSCIVKYVEIERQRRHKRPAPNTAAGKALIELDHLLLDGRSTPSRGHTRIPDGAVLVRRSEWQTACLAKGLSTGETENEKRTFRRAVDQLSGLGLVGTFGDHVWLIGGADKRGLSGAHGSSTRSDMAGHCAVEDFAGENTQ